MSRLIIDVTYLAHWQGKLTGIPRVINEIAVRYAEQSDATMFVSWDNDSQQFLEVDIQKTLLNRGKSLHYLPLLGATAPGTYKKAATFAGRGLRKAKQSYHVPIPSSVFEPLVKQRAASLRSYVSAPEDVFLLTMGEWHNQAYIDAVVAKAERGVKLVQVSYDVLPLVQPQYSGHSTDSLKQYNTAVMPRCELILAISENTKKDLTAWMKSQKLVVPAIKVFRLGDDFASALIERPTDTKFTEAVQENAPYVLCVGTLEARKNHTLLYYTYKLAHQKSIDLPPVAIVGRRGWKTDDLYELITKDPDTKDKLLLLENINDEQLSWLYDNALFTVYPSFYEGWGLPIAESVIRGIPCLASNSSSMPEIAGDLISYFSPLSADELLKGMQMLLKPGAVEKAKHKIKAYKPTTWSDTFTQIDRYIGAI